MIHIEPERYELLEGPEYRFDVTRRNFFKIAGAGLVVACVEPGEALAMQDRRGRGGDAPQDVSAWIHIGEDGVVTAYTGKVEVGQDARTSLAQAVAEELRAPLDSVRMDMGDTDLVPFDMGTFGSRTTPSMAPQLRRAAAAAREALLDMAADRLKVDRAALAVENGRVVHGTSKRSVGFGELTRGQKLLKEIDARARTAAPAGTAVPKANGRDFVTGAHKFASDVKRPGMLVGRVLRPPSLGARLGSVDASGVKGATVARDGDFVGVAAPTEWEAARALSALKAEWRPGPASPSSAEIFDHLRRNAGGGRPEERGSVDAGMAEADVKVEGVFTIAYIAHAPLEPRAAVAEWSEGRLTVWTGTQRPFGVRQELARAFGLAEDRVRVIVPDTGSGYGGKHTGECAIEAARLARETGKPVKLVWTREEEFAHAYFRPAGVIDVRAGAKGGRLVAWEFVNINSGASAIESPYQVANRRVGFRQSRSPWRQGSYRGLAATANNFAREVAIEELARGSKVDPIEFRLQHLRNDRLAAVLRAAADKFGWSSWKPAEGRGIGAACGVEKGGFVATCAEVEARDKSKRFRVLRLTTAFECGAIVNPGLLRGQVEGAVLQGLGAALWEAIEFEGGRITNGHFSQYRVPRFADVPAKFETVLVDRRDLPSAGAGETPIMTVAPAVGNALARAAGARVRSLPIVWNS
jgi:nicotinate dehydrogenase subunit B